MDSTNVHSSLEYAVASSQLFLLLILLTLAFGSFVYYIWAHWICYAVPRLPSRHHNFGGYCEEGAANGSAPVYSAAISSPIIPGESALPPSSFIPPAIQPSNLQANPHPQLHQQSPNHYPPQPAQPDSTASSNTTKLHPIISAVINVINHHNKAIETLLAPPTENLSDNQLGFECPEASPNTRYKNENKNTNIFPNNHPTAHLLSTPFPVSPSPATNHLIISLCEHIICLDSLLQALYSQNQTSSYPSPSPIISPNITTPFPHAQPPANSTSVNILISPTTADPPTSPSCRYSRNQLIQLMQRNSANLTQCRKQISPLISLIPAVPLPPKITKHNIPPSPSTPTQPSHHQQDPHHRPPPSHSNNNNHLLHQLATSQLQQSMIYHQQLLHLISIQAHQLQQHQQFQQNIHFPFPTNTATLHHLQQHITPHHSQRSYPYSNPHYSLPHKPPDALTPRIHHNSDHQPYIYHQPLNIPTNTFLSFPGRPQNPTPHKDPYPSSHHSPQRRQPPLRQPRFLWMKKLSLPLNDNSRNNLKSA